MSSDNPMTDSTNAKLRELRERVVFRSQAYHKMFELAAKNDDICRWDGAAEATDAILSMIDAMIQEAGE